MIYVFIGVLAVILVIVYLFWHKIYFYRDPSREIPSGRNLVSPADGRVVYVKKIKNNKVPIAVKKRKSIKLDEIIETKAFKGDKYLVGIFMTPIDVHIQRVPLSGKVKDIVDFKNRNKPMTLTWVREMLGLMPYYKGSAYLIENERRTILFEGDMPVFVTQIADLAVNKIVSWVWENEHVEKGQRYGMIKFGSQVDIIFPCKKNVRVLVKPGQRVRAGETIVAEY